MSLPGGHHQFSKDYLVGHDSFLGSLLDRESFTNPMCLHAVFVRAPHLANS